MRKGPTLGWDTRDWAADSGHPRVYTKWRKPQTPRGVNSRDRIVGGDEAGLT